MLIAPHGHLFKASRQILDDAKALQSYIDARARYGLLLAEEAQLLYGSGAGANLQGLSGGTSTSLGLGLLGAGAATGLGGVVQMLSPTTTASVGNNNDDGNNPSYGFGGAVTTVAQGNPYPVLYGEREIGGAVESGGIYTQDQI
ncbi:phage major capsid protein [Pseudomonas syringae]|uniref:phage major capsid protein n=1 Tax=Pseudomonas syringae TaxID=317 RepID=UPI000CDB608B|nr:phage major capsid protein [Pseudomonas syringae]POP66548.1 phage major capsid protein [Pseudomonas syringae]